MVARKRVNVTLYVECLSCVVTSLNTLSSYTRTATQIAFSTKPRECIPCEATSINYTDPYLFIYGLFNKPVTISRLQSRGWDDEYMLKNELETMSKNLPYSRERPLR